MKSKPVWRKISLTIYNPNVLVTAPLALKAVDPKPVQPQKG